MEGVDWVRREEADEEEGSMHSAVASSEGRLTCEEERREKKRIRIRREKRRKI